MITPRRINFKGRTPEPVLVVGSVAYDSIITPHATGQTHLRRQRFLRLPSRQLFCPTPHRRRGRP